MLNTFAMFLVVIVVSRGLSLTLPLSSGRSSSTWKEEKKKKKETKIKIKNVSGKMLGGCTFLGYSVFKSIIFPSHDIGTCFVSPGANVVREYLYNSKKKT